MGVLGVIVALAAVYFYERTHRAVVTLAQASSAPLPRATPGASASSSASSSSDGGLPGAASSDATQPTSGLGFQTFICLDGTEVTQQSDCPGYLIWGTKNPQGDVWQP